MGRFIVDAGRGSSPENPAQGQPAPGNTIQETPAQGQPAPGNTIQGTPAQDQPAPGNTIHGNFVQNNPRQRIVAVCGVKNSGKTTLLEMLVRELSGRGIKTAVIKHDGHDFSCDVPGTDSFRLKEAGAYGTAVFSGSRVFVHKTGTGDGVKELVRMFPEADVILIEGMKESTYPKIEVIREGISETPVSEPKGRFLIVTDLGRERFREETAGFQEIGRIAELILGRQGQQEKTEGNDSR